MGFLSNIGKAISGAAKSVATAVVKSPVGKVMDVATVAFVHPIQTIKAVVSPTTTVKQVVETHFAQPLSKQITETVIATAGYAGAVVGGAAIGTAAKAGTLLPALIPATTKGKVIAAIAAPVVLGAVIKEPIKTAETIAGAPSALANVGANVAQFAADPSLEHAKEIITENPIIVGGAAAAAAILGAKALLPAIVGAKQIEAVQEQTEAIREATSGMKTLEQPTTTAPIAPITPATERVVTTAAAKSSTKRKRRSVKAPTQNISQRVNVVVANKSTSTGLRQTHKYLNRELLISR